MSFYEYLKKNLNDDNDVKLLVHEYPFIFQQLPNQVLNCKKIKHILNHHNYDDYFIYKDRLFSKIWLKYFKWKLLYNNDIDTETIINR